MADGEVTLNVLDGGGAVAGPNQNTQVVIGTATAGTAATVVATRSTKTLSDTFTSGPLPEAAALSVLKGGTVLAMRAATVTAGAATAVTTTGSGTSVMTVTGTPVDDYNVHFRVIKGGTIGSAGITFQVSLDAGRHFGPVLALGTANTFLISGTGITLNFAAGTLVALDFSKFSTTAPLWDIAGVLACIAALKVSQYAVAGWGSFHIVGPISAADAATLNTALEDLATSTALYTRVMVSARDAHNPIAWGGAGETEQAWLTAIEADFAATSARRLLVSGGHYNIPSAYPNAHAGAPSYRRPGLWAVAARRVTIPPQRHDGRVKDFALNNITLDPSNDPLDGFVYHDEQFVAGLDTARFCSYRTRRGRGGYFVKQPNLMSPLGSVFTLLPLGIVMDKACGIVHAVGEDEINDDVQLNKNGTLVETFARALETTVYNNLKADMIDAGEISDADVVVDRNWNVKATSKVPFAVTVFSRGYILDETVTIGYSNPFAAGN